MTAPRHAIEIEHLSKIYSRRGRETEALQDITLKIPRGSIFGLLGPNGAGKSTLINIMAGLVHKSAGRITIWGHDIDRQPRDYKFHIGIVPQELNLDSFFTVRNTLDVQAGLWGIHRGQRRTDELLNAMHLGDKARMNTRTLSGGMRRRLMIAKAMAHTPPILVLDEPTAGVDIELRRQLWDYVRDLNKKGTTILLTTHYLEEAEALCDEIAILHHGRLIAQDKTKTLISKLDQKDLTLVLNKKPGKLPALQAFNPRIDGNTLCLRYRPSKTKVGEILAAVSKAGYTITDLTTTEPDLEDVFLSFTRG